MPQTAVYFYQEADGTSPVLEWFADLRRANPKGFANCLAKLRLLRSFGYELRRPAADYLRDGIYELRAKHGTVQYRLLYFFDGRNVAVVTHALTKKARVPPADIARAIERRTRYAQNPTRHRHPQAPEGFETPS